ncbi:hypothetical protein BS47DRAFT_1367016 [Hydnum rufescens UP504]|uniref:Uncharacterized protein n=1 Tax=Hydnum rufescens UP504 TaxID=1448309 RepID=A0A9P6AJC4_9AGAM|nr:hypothetical protein BS47DRAFT_1367016 [Hydnum rufescens UP504]
MPRTPPRRNPGTGMHDMRPQGTQTNHTPASADCQTKWGPTEQTPLEMKMGPTNDDHPDKTSDKTTHPPKRVCGNFMDPRPHQTNMGEQQPAHQTKPTNGNQKHNTSARQTTHPLWQVPSLRENPHMDEPQVRAATQAQSAHPLNMTIDEIAYHTPAVADVYTRGP